MKHLTLEKAKALLKELDPSMPERFDIVSTAYSRKADAYYVKWFDPDEKRIYDDAVSKDTAAGAKAAYGFQPSFHYSVIWFNEGENGDDEPVVMSIEPKDLSDMRKNPDDLVQLDC